MVRLLSLKRAVIPLISSNPTLRPPRPLMKLKPIAFAILTLPGLCLLAGAAIYLQDLSYPTYQYEGIPQETRKALLLTWKSEAEKTEWVEYEKGLFPLISNLHKKNKVALTLPFSHEPLKHPEQPATWDHSVIVLFPKSTDETESVKKIVESALALKSKLDLRSIDMLRLQNGLDMFYPINDGKATEGKLEQSIEYVFSKPQSRAAYYRAQYEWSGPAMTDLHQRDKAGRFIGFELTKRLYGAEKTPRWDLIHVFGFTPWQAIKVKPFFLDTWNKHARRVFGDQASFSKVISEWNKIRLKVQSKVQQPASLTLQAKS